LDCGDGVRPIDMRSPPEGEQILVCLAGLGMRIFWKITDERVEVFVVDSWFTPEEMLRYMSVLEWSGVGGREHLDCNGKGLDLIYRVKIGSCGDDGVRTMLIMVFFSIAECVIGRGFLSLSWRSLGTWIQIWVVARKSPVREVKNR
jgi:hypothetical protein